MATRVIPEQKITTCDVCEIVVGKGNRARNGRLVLKRDALDYQGNAIADASIIMRDLCDGCLERISDVINRETENIRTEQRLGWGD